ncbi:MAG: ABC transporter permease [Tepidisphaera sp.]|jgi:ABC-2 type transport system permease protein
MNKTIQVAIREFWATVATKGFIIGIFLPPLLAVVMVPLMILLMRGAAPKISGHVALIDRSGEVAQAFTKELSPESVAERMAKFFDKESSVVKAAGGDKMIKQGVEQAMGSANVEVRVLPPDTDPEVARQEILNADAKNSGTTETRLAVVVIPAEVVRPVDGKDPASYEVLHSPKLAVQWIGLIEDAARRSVVEARIRAAGLDPVRVRQLSNPPRGEVRSVTREGTVKTNEIAKLMIPGAFMFLIWIAVFTSGQYLLTSTIEEKSSRVMEVLLSAVSPMQLLAGKIAGQACVGLLILLVYAGAGIVALISATMFDIIDPMMLVYLVIYFMIAFASIACLFAAVGSAVSDIREAQSLIGPVMIILVIPMMLWMPILQNPNSTFAQICSFVPPISPFIMILRLAGAESVPIWQIPATIVLGILTVVVMAWMAAKIFRIGVLMYGKPPNISTLIRWIRMA